MYQGWLWCSTRVPASSASSPARGTFEAVAFCPGYLRGPGFLGDFAVVGLSRQRRNRNFRGLDLDRRPDGKGVATRCAVPVIDLRRGDVAHELRIEGVVEELFDTAVLATPRRTGAAGFVSDEIRRIQSLPPEAR